MGISDHALERAGFGRLVLPGGKIDGDYTDGSI